VQAANENVKKGKEKKEEKCKENEVQATETMLTNYTTLNISQTHLTYKIHLCIYHIYEKLNKLSY